MHIRTSKFSLFALTVSVLALSACGSDSSDKKPLAGERISVLEMQKALEPDSTALEAQGFVAPEIWVNEFWPQNGGYPNHAMQNLALPVGALKKQWNADIGDGAEDRTPLVTQPILVDGRIFTIDSHSSMRAFDIKTGKRMWEQEIAPQSERKDPIIAGGVAYSQGRLYVTNGFAELLIIDPASGKIIMRKALPGPSRAAPTIQDNRVFVVTMDNHIQAFDVENGNLLWEFAGMAETTGLVGAASPAASHDVVIPAFSSGEIFALQVENGAVSWSDNLSTTRKIGNLASLSDIRGLPILDKGLVFAISYSGKMVAIDERTGTRIWQRDIGGTETPWVAGNHIFVISANQELVGIGRDKGEIHWVTALPKYKNMDKKKDPILWTGPVLAGGRLIAASSTGTIMEFDPATGKTIRSWDAAGPVTIPPIVAGGVLYILSDNGTLSAYK